MMFMRRRKQEGEGKRKRKGKAGRAIHRWMSRGGRGLVVCTTAWFDESGERLV